MDEKKKIIIESNPRRDDDLYSKFKKEKGFKVGEMAVIIGSSTGRSHMADLAEQIKNMEHDFKKAVMIMGEAGVAGANAAIALKCALEKMQPIILCPEDMMVMDINMDFSGLEKIVIDSLSGMTMGPTPSKYNGVYYDECSPISKKAYKKLLKSLDKKEKISHKQDQTDRWCNKWDTKIKKKL